MQDVPTFLGLGMSRSGTRWLAECLAEHPQVCIAPSEVHFFVRRRLLKTWQNGHGWYVDLLKRCDKEGARAWGEISPSYLGDSESAELIHHYAPKAKLICSLRDQSEWLYSAYRLFLHFNPELFGTSYSFRTFLVYSPHIFVEVFYLEHIRNYLKFFPKDQLLILLYDDLKQEPELYIKRIYAFLGVDDSFIPPSVRMTINPMELVTCRSYALAKLTKRVSPHPVLGWLTRPLDRLNAIHVKREEFPERHRLTADLKKEIRDIYAEHNKQLGAFLGRDITHWNRVD